jgi:phosphatidate cytidylyltransferase
VFIIAGVLGSIINIFGDLFESFIKRRAGIKDMGKLLPGHGGVMDRIDGTSFVIALIYLLFLIF